MRRRAVVLSPDAEADARVAFVWYLGRSAEAADRFESEVADALDRLADGAEQGPELEAGLRRLLLRRFP